MSSSALEKQIAALLQKRQELDLKLKNLEQQKAKEFRQQQAKKHSIIGAVVLNKLQAGEKVLLASEEDLHALLNTALTAKLERALFGLETPEEERQMRPPSQPQASKAGHTGAEGEAPQQPPTPQTATTAPKSKTRLPSSDNQQEMLNEFNL